MTEQHPGQPRDISLTDWLDGVGFHPADTELKQRAHELARLMTATYATHMHNLLPAGRDKSLVFTHLEDVLVRANRAIALGKGPRPGVELEPNEGRAGLRTMVAEFKQILADLDARVPYDPRIAQYEATQRGERVNGLPVPPERPIPGQQAVQPLEPFEYRTGEEPDLVRSLSAALTATGAVTPEVQIQTSEHDEGENYSSAAAVYVDDPEVLEDFASYLLTMANQLRALQARPKTTAAVKDEDVL